MSSDKTDMIEKYTDYAIENDVFSDGLVPEDTKYLVTACNRHHQNYLLYEQNGKLGHLADTRCRKKFDYDPATDCDGVYTNGDSKCDCGYKWYWNDFGFDPSDTTKFNIDRDEPYGYIDH
jgi:hypothetical protein